MPIAFDFIVARKGVLDFLGMRGLTNFVDYLIMLTITDKKTELRLKEEKEDK